MAAEAAWLAPAAAALGRHALALFLALLLLLPLLGWAGWQRLSAGSGITGPAGCRRRSRIGVAAAALGGAVFATLATLLTTGDALPAADQAFANSVRASVPAAALSVFAALTHLADTATLTALCTVMALLMAARRQPALAVGWVLAVAGNGMLNRSLKALFGRARGMLAYTVLRLLPARWHSAALVAAVALAWTIGASRVFLGVHFASDVIAGFASGGVWLLLCFGAMGLAPAPSR